MENREAIELVTRFRDAFVAISHPAFEAMTMAISALEKQENVCEKCEYNIMDDDELPCCDCIRLGNKGGREDYYKPYTEEEV